MTDTDNAIAAAEATYDSEHPFATGGNPVSPVTHQELGLILNKVIASIPVGTGEGGAPGLSKADVEKIASKVVADFGNSGVFQDVVKRLAPQPLTNEQVEAVAAEAIVNFASSPAFSDVVNQLIEARVATLKLPQVDAPIKGADTTVKPSQKKS